MSEYEEARNRDARAAAERALVRVVRCYGARPEFVVLGGLVPELLCANSEYQHAGTTDIDVQVNLEISCGAVNTRRLERALRDAGFEPDNERTWRWTIDDGASRRAVVKFELLSDLDDEPAGVTVNFTGCDHLGAANLRGTRFAARDVQVRTLSDGDGTPVEVNVTGLAGFLMAKCAAARSRRSPKDWYDIAFVLLHNERGGPEEAAAALLASFRDDLPSMRTAFDDLHANFADVDAQGPSAYAEQMHTDHPELDLSTLRADAVVAVSSLHGSLFGSPR